MKKTCSRCTALTGAVTAPALVSRTEPGPAQPTACPEQQKGGENPLFAMMKQPMEDLQPVLRHTPKHMQD